MTTFRRTVRLVESFVYPVRNGTSPDPVTLKIVARVLAVNAPESVSFAMFEFVEGGKRVARPTRHPNRRS